MALALCLAGLTAPTLGLAQLKPGPAAAPLAPVPSATLVGDTGRYAASFAGVRDYMAELATRDPLRHALLAPTYESLRQRRRRVVGAGASFVLLGLAAMALALTFDDDLPRATRVGTLYGGTSATFVGGAMLGVLSGRHDAERFVAAHQRLLPGAGLHIEVDGATRGARIVARARF
jgi:hypothetical protein